MKKIDRKNGWQKGFSLIELLIVMVILGIISAMGIPLLKKAKLKTENTAALQTTRTMSQAQVSFFAGRSRYARLNELNAEFNNTLGTNANNSIQRGSFTYTMSPAYQTDADLKTNYEFFVTRTAEAAELPYVIKVSGSGEIVQITP